MRQSVCGLLALLVALFSGVAGAQTPKAPTQGIESASLVVQLLADDGEADDGYGASVAASNDTMVIGAFGDDDKGSNAGAAYVYVFDGLYWVKQQKLTASDGANFDAFGSAVAIDGDTIVVGAFADDAASGGTGAAYVFVRNAGAWSQQQKLLGEPDVDWFALSVAVSGDTIIVGSPLDLDNGTSAGAVHVFVRSGVSWTQQQKIAPADGTDFDRFGEAVAISGETLIAGAFNDFVFDFGSGSAYVYNRSGTSWAMQQKLTPSDGGRFDYFGIGVAIDGDTALIGANEDGGGGTGSAYVFTRSDSVWSEQQKLAPSDGEAQDMFGQSVSVSADSAVIGAPNLAGTGSAHLFTRLGSVWTEEEILRDPDGATGDFFGYTVSAAKTTLVVGASGDDDLGSSSGSAFVFETGPTLSIEGVCPSSVSMEITQARPGARLAIGRSASLGSFAVPVGICAGTTVGLKTPTLLTTVTADEEGAYSFTTPVPAGACGLYIQALDLSSCSVTNVGMIPD